VKARLSFASSVVLFALGARPAPAAVVLQARAFDGEATARAILENFQRESRPQIEGLRVPWTKPLTVSLIETGERRGATEGGSAGRSWTVTPAEGGAFTLDTGLDALAGTAYFVASAPGPGGRTLYSPFFRPGADLVVNLYPITEDSARVSGTLHVAYDLITEQGSGKDDKDRKAEGIRIRAGLNLRNDGADMYVGRRAGSSWREVWRLPFPRDAKLVLNKGPDGEMPGWTVSGDGRWLILDSPVPGLSELNTAGFTWQAEFVVPPRQNLFQEYPVSLPLEPNRFVLWWEAEVIEVAGPDFAPPAPRTYPDPFTSDDRRKYEATGGKGPFPAGRTAGVVVTVDNVPLNQVSRQAVKWVGGFILAVVLSILLGLACGRKRPAPDVLFAGLSGEEVLDRIADLDRRFDRREIREDDYRRHREVLVELAAEELGTGEEGVAARPKAGDTTVLGRGLAPHVQDILRRIDEIERNGAVDPARIAERAHLLEALAKALPREAPRG
jgi:hypothetical protein